MALTARNKLEAFPVFTPRDNAVITTLVDAKTETRLRVRLLFKLSKNSLSRPSVKDELRDVAWRIQKSYFEWKNWRHEIAAVLNDEGYPEVAMKLIKPIMKAFDQSKDEGLYRLSKNLFGSSANFSDYPPFGKNLAAHGAIEVMLSYLANEIRRSSEPPANNFLTKSSLQLLLNLSKSPTYTSEIMNNGASNVFPILISGEDEEVKCLAALCHLNLLNIGKRSEGYYDEKNVGLVFIKAITAWLESGDERRDVRVSLEAIEALLDGICHLCAYEPNKPKLLQAGVVEVIQRLLELSSNNNQSVGLRSVNILLGLFSDQNDKQLVLMEHEIDQLLTSLRTMKMFSRLDEKSNVSKAINVLKDWPYRLSSQAQTPTTPTSPALVVVNNNGQRLESVSPIIQIIESPSISDVDGESPLSPPAIVMMANNDNSNNKDSLQVIYEIAPTRTVTPRSRQSSLIPVIAGEESSVEQISRSPSPIGAVDDQLIKDGGSSNPPRQINEEAAENRNRISFNENVEITSLEDAVTEIQLRLRFLDKHARLSESNLVCDESKRALQLVSTSLNDWQQWQAEIAVAMLEENFPAIALTYSKALSGTFFSEYDLNQALLLVTLYSCMTALSECCPRVRTDIVSCGFLAFLFDFLQKANQDANTESGWSPAINGIVAEVINLLNNLSQSPEICPHFSKYDAVTILGDYSESPVHGLVVNRLIHRLMSLKIDNPPVVISDVMQEEPPKSPIINREATATVQDSQTATSSLAKEPSQHSEVDEASVTVVQPNNEVEPFENNDAAINEPTPLLLSNKHDEEPPDEEITVVNISSTTDVIESPRTEENNDNLKTMTINDDEVSAISLHPTAVVPPSSLRNWSFNDVQTWLKEEHLHQIFSGKMADFDGTKLCMLFEIERKAPEYYYNTISKHFNESLPNMLQLYAALNRLSSSQQW